MTKKNTIKRFGFWIWGLFWVLKFGFWISSGSSIQQQREARRYGDLLMIFENAT